MLCYAKANAQQDASLADVAAADLLRASPRRLGPPPGPGPGGVGTPCSAALGSVLQAVAGSPALGMPEMGLQRSEASREARRAIRARASTGAVLGCWLAVRARLAAP
jgi:hypothetical protein